MAGELRGDIADDAAVAADQADTVTDDRHSDDLSGMDQIRAQMRLGEMGLSGFSPYLMNRIMGRYNASLRNELAALGLTTPKMRALAILSVIEGPLIRDLAVYAVTEQSTLSRALDGLAADGLVRREQDRQDSRGIRIYLTPAGRETFENLWPRMAESHAVMFRGISEQEHLAFVATLQKLLVNVRQHDF